MRRQAFAVLAVALLVLGPTMTALAQAEKPVVIRVVIGGNNTLSPTLFRVEKGSLVRLILENQSNQTHGLISNQTKDTIWTKPGETKVLEFTVTELPLSFACTVPNTPNIRLEPLSPVRR